MRNKSKTRKFFRTETEDRKCFPDIETARPEYAIYPELCSSSSHTFMYVENFETRDYQMEISKSSVTKNTLIIIPTGLGKTFIAAMIIINFYRWFPTGKIIFMATSRPLVKQQMDSIKQLNMISKKDIVEITGGVSQNVRTNYWSHSRVFFATPQTIQKDIERGVCPVSQIVLIVVDEAHHARGNHSYCQIIRKVAEVTKFFRIIALTATPGSTVYDIQQVIFNLLISQIEIRTDEDCSKYIHTREIKSVIIQDAPGVAELSARLNSILQEYLEKLLKMSLVTTKDPTRTSKGKIALLMKTQHSGEACIAIKQSIRLLNLREKLENYSIPFFTHDLEEYINSSDRPIDDTNDELKMLLAAAKRSPQEDPKMAKLCEIVVKFLETSDEKSKIIVFCSYRNVVKEIVKKLSEASPIIKCTEFVGQSSSSAGLRGLNQPKQLKVMDAFKRGIFNVLISTSIGEEGLDIGEVDLIICYDVQKSATRTIQRMGRTGRHQDGSVIFLLSEASKNLLYNAEKATDSTSNLISKNMSQFEFYKNCPKMNDNNLQTIFKKFSAEEMKNYEKQMNKEKEVKRAVLLTSELEELHEHHGEILSYRKFELNSSIEFIAGAVFCFDINNSAESTLLSNIYSEINEFSIQNTPLNSLSSLSQIDKKQEDSLKLDEKENFDFDLSEKSPFAIDESSSQKKFSNLSPFSSQKKPEKISVRKLLNIDMSTDTSASDSDYEYDIFSPKNKKKKKQNKNEIDEIRKNAKCDMKNEISKLTKDAKEIKKIQKQEEEEEENEVMNQVSEEKNFFIQPKKNSIEIEKSGTNQTEPLKILAEIDEISSDSKGNSNGEVTKKIGRISFNDEFDDEETSGFIPPNTRSTNSSNSTSSVSSSKRIVMKKSDRKKGKDVSLLSGSETDYEEEEEQTSLSGFIVNSSEEVQDNRKIMRKVKYMNSYSSMSESEDEDDHRRMKDNRRHFQKQIQHPKIDEESDNDDDEDDRHLNHFQKQIQHTKIDEDDEEEDDRHHLNYFQKQIQHPKINEDDDGEEDDRHHLNYFQKQIQMPKTNEDEEEDDDDVAPLNPEEIEEMTQHFSNKTNVQQQQLPQRPSFFQNQQQQPPRLFQNQAQRPSFFQNQQQQPPPFIQNQPKQPHFFLNRDDGNDEQNSDEGKRSDNEDDDEVFPVSPDEETIQRFTNPNFNDQAENDQKDDFENDEKNIIQVSSQSSEHSQQQQQQEEQEKAHENSLLRIFTQNDLERIINEENVNNSFLNSSSDDNYDIVMESSSFVSTSSELIVPESSDFEDENENDNVIEIDSSLPLQNSNTTKTRNSNFFHQMIDEEETENSESDTELKKMSSTTYRNLLKNHQTTDDDDEGDLNGSQKNGVKISGENISFVPLGKLANKEGRELNLKKIELPQNSSSNDSFDDFEDSTE